MSLFGGPEEHAANPPSTWQVVKAGDRLWHLRTADGTTLDRFDTRKAATEALTCSWLVRMYAQDKDWYAGKTPPGWRSWADVKAERERIAAKWGH